MVKRGYDAGMDGLVDMVLTKGNTRNGNKNRKSPKKSEDESSRNGLFLLLFLSYDVAMRAKEGVLVAAGPPTPLTPRKGNFPNSEIRASM